MNRLEHVLMAQISQTGPMTLESYMEICLLHPVLGFYNRDAPIGARGGFVTAPEISQMFGELIGLTMVNAWNDQGCHESMTLLDLGPGRGTLMDDLLRATARFPGFNSCAQLHLHEASKTLRIEQSTRLDIHHPVWLDRLDDLPDQPLYAVANEYFDVLPIRQFHRKEDSWVECVIGMRNGTLSRGYSTLVDPGILGDRVDGALPGDVVEVRPAAETAMSILSDRIRRHGGMLLVIDYGEEHLCGDTWQAVAGNERADPLVDPGEADLTSHVDFGALARCGQGLCHSGPCPQGEFLERLGIAERARRLANNMQDDDLRGHVAAYHRLVHPEEMGKLFKAMAFYPCSAANPPGFA